MTTATTTTPVQGTGARRARRGRRLLAYGATLVVLLAAWAAYDLYAPRQTSLREFDADEVARLDVLLAQFLD